MAGRALLLIVAAAVATPAASQSISFDNSPPLAPNKANAKGDKLICEKEETLGTRLGAQKVCLTETQWQERRREQRETLEKFQRQQTSVGPPSG